MKRTSRILMAAATLAAGMLGSAALAQDGFYPDEGYYPGHPKLFRNYYTQGPGTPAQLYVSPRPTPAYVGHTWITYEPLMPHEFLYAHHRSYYAHHPDCSWTKTKVHWGGAHGLPFVRTLHESGAFCCESIYAPWQNPWQRMR